MSRRIVIGILIILIVGILGGIVAFTVYRLRGDTPPLPQATPIQQQLIDPAGDSDFDGLTNADETLWGTNPNTQDTDGDGYKDGEEVAANHNPTIPGPNDKLPELTSSTPAQTSFDSFFADNVDLTGGKKNLTQEYARSVPDKDKSPVSLAQFIQSQPLNTTLPRVDDAQIKIEKTTITSLAEYMLAASTIGILWDKSSMNTALNEFYDNRQVYGFVDIANQVYQLHNHVAGLTVPNEAIRYQRILLGYCKLLIGTLLQVANYDADQARAMVAIRQLDAIDRLYFPLIAQEKQRLLNYQAP